MANRFVKNPAGFQKLENRTETSEAMVKIAERILPEVVANGGRFTNGYKVQKRKVEGTAGARLGTDDPFAHWDEWGNIHRRPRAPLRRALASFGLLGQTKLKGKN